MSQSQTILILGAMDEEIALLTQSLTSAVEETIQHLTCHRGEYAGQQLIIARCGIGKVAAALAAGVLVNAYQPDIVINTGSSGGYDPRLQVGDIVIANELVQFDVDLTNFGYAHGQPAGMPVRFTCDPDLVGRAEQSAALLNDIKAYSGLIGTSDKFICEAVDTQRISALFPDITAVEMEGAAIAQACHMLNTRCLVIRCISDLANEDSTHPFEEYLAKAAKHSAALVMSLVKSF